jgi:DNA-binding HxlR family transcriptional regulator
MFLQRDGYAKRTVLPTKPPSVEYALSSLGISLFAKLALVLEWGRTIIILWSKRAASSTLRTTTARCAENKELASGRPASATKDS